MSGESLLTAGYDSKRESVVQDEKDVMFVDYRQDHIQLTCGMYEAFLSRGRRGRDALGIYLHFLYTYRRQKTSRVWATNPYVQQGLDMGESRVEHGKNLLRKMGIIRTVRERDARGRLSKAYVKLNLLPDPGPMPPKQVQATIPAENEGMDPKDGETTPEGCMIPSTPAVTTRVVPDPKCLKKKVKRNTASVDAASKTSDTSHRNSSAQGEKTPNPS